MQLSFEPSRALRAAAMLAVAVLVTACQMTPPPEPPEPLMFDGEAALGHVVAQIEFGFRPTGSEAGWATSDYIIAYLEEQGWAVETQEFVYRDTPVRNIVGSSPSQEDADSETGDRPIIMLGAHYDTRSSADMEDPSVPVMGANDGASGVAVLLELARTLDHDRSQHEIQLAFYDAEEFGMLLVCQALGTGGRGMRMDAIRTVVGN